MAKGSQRYNVAPHGDQPRPRGNQRSHHIESQTRAKKVIANYNADKDPTLLVSEAEHQRTFKPQRAAMAQPDHDKNIGTGNALKSAYETAAAAVKGKGGAFAAARATLSHAGHLF